MNTQGQFYIENTISSVLSNQRQKDAKVKQSYNNVNKYTAKIRSIATTIIAPARDKLLAAEHLKNERLVAKIWFYRNKLIESFRTNEYTILYKKFIAHLTDGITDSN